MGLGDLFRSVNYTATDTVTGITENFVIDGGIVPDWSYGAYDGAMSLPGAWRAATLISDLVGQLPWHGYRDRAGKSAEKLSPTPTLLEYPAGTNDTAMTVYSSLALDLVWHGNAIAIVASRGRDGWPTGIQPVQAEMVRARRTTQADGFIGVPRGSVVYEIGSEVFAPYDVIHIKGPCRPGALRGLSVLENHLNKTLKLADEQSRQAQNLGSSGVPTGLLKSSDPEFDEKDARELSASWHFGQRDRKVAVLNSTTDFVPIAWTPEQTQLLEARKFSLHEIALIFGLAPSWLGVGDTTMTYSNLETEWANLVRATLASHVVRMEQALSAHLPRGTWAKANLDGLLRGTTQDRYTAYGRALAGGWMTRNEVRQLEDMPPLPGGDELPTEAPTFSEEGTRSLLDLKKYWIFGEGRAKWDSSPEPLPTLYGFLLKYMTPVKARAAALSWFEIAKGRNPVAADGQIPFSPGDSGED
jgi:HK97 family phage portal protein